jgi:hypothetical protein
MAGAPKNLFQQQSNKTANEVGQPPDDIERISYGIVTEVDPQSSQVKVRFLTADKTPGELVSEGFLPILNSLSQIFILYGSLRPGLLVRIFWRGKIKPKTAIIEVIGDEDSSFLAKDFDTNEVNVGPWFIFSGSLTG